ncbi:MAG: N-methyl-L-tryptophan oxidase [Sulfobacillus acidophilus]|uniref:N-methyl-L-tryptophan oxidase n=1 Tax=Sulfobacillus acidophilus TaxID=53633 RepID=A0A2T2WFX3_9FIRM|nr:MAG: N-methyl-L-tryptophan oxidase [Sulfobacillus acidophilus]
MPYYDVAVIGLGIMGSSALYAAAHMGLTAIGFDQSPTLPHTQGSSHGQTRIIRQAYFEHPDYVPLVHRAYDAWHQLEQKAQSPIFIKTGGLMMGLPQSSVVSGSIAAAQKHHLPYEVWTAKALRARYPAFTLGADEVAVYEEAAGYLLAERAWTLFFSLAKKYGACIRHGVKVRGWHLAPNRIQLAVDDEIVEVNRLIVTVGPWIQQIWPKVPVRVERQVPFWLDSPELARLANHPIFIRETPHSAAQIYGFPYLPGEGFKIARHHGGVEGSIDTLSRTVTDADEQSLRHHLHFLPAALRAPVKSCTVCVYTNTADMHFIVGRLPQSNGRIVVGAGFSGHGFKFASVLGPLLVEQAYHSQLLPELQLFAPQRFA